MPKTKVALTIDADLLDQVDALVSQQKFRNRSQAIEAALADKLRLADLNPVRRREQAGQRPVLILSHDVLATSDRACLRRGARARSSGAQRNPRIA